MEDYSKTISTQATGFSFFIKDFMPPGAKLNRVKA